MDILKMLVKLVKADARGDQAFYVYHRAKLIKKARRWMQKLDQGK